MAFELKTCGSERAVLDFGYLVERYLFVKVSQIGVCGCQLTQQVLSWSIDKKGEVPRRLHTLALGYGSEWVLGVGRLRFGHLCFDGSQVDPLRCRQLFDHALLALDLG